MKRLPEIGSLAKLNGKTVKVMRIYGNGNFASTIGVVEHPVSDSSKAFEVRKEDLTKI